MFEINVGSSLLDYYASVSVVFYFYHELNLLTVSLFYFGIMTVTIPGMFCFPRKLPYYKSCVLFTGIVLDKLVSIVIKLSFFFIQSSFRSPRKTYSRCVAHLSVFISHDSYNCSEKLYQRSFWSDV